MRSATEARTPVAIGPGARLARAGFAISIAACIGLGALHLAGWTSTLDAAAIVPAFAGLWLGALAADLASGAVHWACDTWGDEQTRWVGASLIFSFREHHREPRKMLEHDWIEVNGQPAAAAAVGFGVLALPDAHDAIGDRAFVHAFLWALFTVAALANQLHQWAHSPAPPSRVGALQRSGWILSPVHHARHHAPPHTSHYCITSGWLNGVLDASGFWRALERALTRLTGAIPRRAPEGPGGSRDGVVAIVRRTTRAEPNGRDPLETR